MDKRLLDILCCPATRQPLRVLRREELDALNHAVAEGTVCTVGAAALEHTLQAGLITCDGKLIYRVDDEIPVMLADEAVATAQVPGFPVR
jgi:uncharacterized protein YbaR (Trm112 family)